MEITEELAAGTTEATRKRMSAAFVLSFGLEWIFRDNAYRMEAWPP